MKSEKVREALERIRSAAVERARQGIAQKKATINTVRKESPPSPGPVVERLQEGIKGPLASEIAKKVVDDVSDSLLSTFQEALGELQREAIVQSQFPQAARSPDGDILLYPDGCRFMHVMPLPKWQDGYHGVMVVEQQPQVRTLLIDTNQRHVPLPYVVFVISFTKLQGYYSYSGIQIGFNNKPISSLDDHLYYPPLPNFSGHGVCMGSYEGKRNARSPADVANDAISTFWQSVFAAGMQQFQLKGKNVSSWAGWEKIEPLDILKATFQRGSSVRAMMPQSAGTLNTEDRKLVNEVIQRAWRKVSKELQPDDATALIQSCSQEILSRLLSDLTLQPQRNEVESQRQDN